MLELKNINKYYRKKQVLFDITHVFGTGVYGILGPNGAGKSTLLQIITDNLRMDSGQVIYYGKEIQKDNKRYKSILGYVPQIQDIYENFTAYQFLEYVAALKGLNRHETPYIIKNVLNIIGLAKNASQKLMTYSGGMKQRIIIGQALLGDPKLLVLDEPTAGLDPKERIKLRNYLSILGEKTIIIYATHVVSDIENIAKEVILLGDGKILNYGSVGQLCSNIDGKVFECLIPGEKILLLEERTIISNIQEVGNGNIVVRCIAERNVMDNITKCTFKSVPANLQEVYLYNFMEIP